MGNIAIGIIGLAGIVIAAVVLWYSFKTARIMWGYSALLAIAAVIFSPLVHIVFYFIPKNEFEGYEKLMFKRYFLSIAVIPILGILVAMAIPFLEEGDSNTMVNEVDTSQPWDWDIHAEDQEVTLAEPLDDKAAELHFEAIYQSHPDADKVIESPEFAQWLQNKTSEDRSSVDNILKEGTSAEVIYTLSVFKKDLADYRTNEYQAKRDNAQALAQRQYQEKQNREMESFKANNQRVVQQKPSNQAVMPAHTTTSTARKLSYDEKIERERLKDLISKPINGAKGLTASQTEQLIALEQAPAPAMRRGYNERQEYERAKARISEPLKGSNGQLTRAQRDALVSLETGQPMPTR